MDKIYSKNFRNVIIPDMVFLIIDNKDNRRFVTINQKKIKLNKKEIDITFFENKELNTFWSIEFGKNNCNFIQIQPKDFFNDRSTKII